MSPRGKLLNIVDESNPIPKYIQISTWIKGLLQSGRYKVGDKIPSEAELTKMCSVNRNTVRQAISELSALGLLRKERGKGIFVAAASSLELRHKLESISSFTELMQSRGIKQSSKILKQGVIIAEENITKTLLLGSNKKVILVCRVIEGNDIPIIYEETYLPYDNFKGILNMDLSGSMYKIITENFNVVLARSNQIISSVNLDHKISKILKIPSNSAGYYIESLTFDEHNMPIELLYSYHRGDKYKLEIELERYHFGNI
jgi:GntR family transcriptional regulator